LSCNPQVCFSSARLVKGAHAGEGLGNAFLSHIRAVDGIFQVVRVFDDADVTHVEGTVDPIRDLDIIGHELRLKDLQLVDAEVARLEKVVRQIDKTKKGDLELTVRVKEWLEAGKDVRDGKWAAAEIPHINSLQLLTAKVMVGCLFFSLCFAAHHVMILRNPARRPKSMLRGS
jgi:obg-like ATPase 1